MSEHNKVEHDREEYNGHKDDRVKHNEEDTNRLTGRMLTN